MHCPSCGQGLCRELHQRHYHCRGCGSVFIPPQGIRDGGGRVVESLLKGLAVPLDGAEAVGHGVTVAQALQRVSDTMEAFAAVLKGLGDGDQGIGLGGHDAKSVQAARAGKGKGGGGR